MKKKGGGVGAMTQPFLHVFKGIQGGDAGVVSWKLNNSYEIKYMYVSYNSWSSKDYWSPFNTSYKVQTVQTILPNIITNVIFIYSK